MKKKNMYIFESRSSEEYGKKTGIIIKLNDNILEVKTLFGCCPIIDEVDFLIKIFLSEYTKEVPLKKYERKVRYRFIMKEGMSRAVDYFIETEGEEWEFPKRKLIYHESMEGKLNRGMKIFIYDYLDLSVVQGMYYLDDKDNYIYNSEDCNFTLDCITVGPRNTREELGWTSPDEMASEVIDIASEEAIVSM